MLKVSWKILGQTKSTPRNFHMVKALVLMPPPGDPNVEPPMFAGNFGIDWLSCGA